MKVRSQLLGWGTPSTNMWRSSPWDITNTLPALVLLTSSAFIQRTVWMCGGNNTQMEARGELFHVHSAVCPCWHPWYLPLCPPHLNAHAHVFWDSAACALLCSLVVTHWPAFQIQVNYLKSTACQPPTLFPPHFGSLYLCNPFVNILVGSGSVQMTGYTSLWIEVLSQILPLVFSSSYSSAFFPSLSPAIA